MASEGTIRAGGGYNASKHRRQGSPSIWPTASGVTPPTACVRNTVTFAEAFLRHPAATAPAQAWASRPNGAERDEPSRRTSSTPGAEGGHGRERQDDLHPGLPGPDQHLVQPDRQRGPVVARQRHGVHDLQHDRPAELAAVEVGLVPQRLRRLQPRRLGLRQRQQQPLRRLQRADGRRLRPVRGRARSARRPGGASALAAQRRGRRDASSCSDPGRNDPNAAAGLRTLHSLGKGLTPGRGLFVPPLPRLPPRSRRRSGPRPPSLNGLPEPVRTRLNP